MADFTFIGDDSPGRQPLAAFVGNAEADLHWTATADESVPVTVGRGRQASACYLTSLPTAWLRYPAQELVDRFPRSARWLTRLAAIADRTGIGRAVLVGNLPISTNLYGERAALLLEALDRVGAQHRDRWIGVRNLRPDRQPELAAHLADRGFALLPARVVYEFETESGTMPKSSHLKRDLALVRQGALKVIEHDQFDPNDFGLVTAFYAATYLDKHSQLNASYSRRFFLECWRRRALDFIGLRTIDDRLAGFAAIYVQGEVMTVPALGHDPTLPRTAGAYRCLTASLIARAAARRLRFNYSSGAGDAKRKRGAVARLEYTALHAPDWIGSAALGTVADLAKRYVTCERLQAHGA